MAKPKPPAERKPFSWSCPRCQLGEQRMLTPKEAAKVTGKGLKVRCNTYGCGMLLVKHTGGKTSATPIRKAK